MSVLELAEVGFAYRGAFSAALSRLGLRIESGEMIAVLGPQGAGTSTLCRLVTGLLKDRGTVTGAIRVHGRAVMLGDDPEAQLSGMTSTVDDEVQLPGRLQGIGAVEARERGFEALRTLGIGHLRGRRLETLSGGQRQLLALAGVLSLDPALLVLDQPTLSLDPGTRLTLLDGLREFCAAGGAVLIAGHQFDELTAACSRIHALSAGVLSEIRSDGQTPEPEEIERRGAWDTRASADAHPSRSEARRPVAPRAVAARRQSRISNSRTPEESPEVLSVRNLTVSYGRATVLDDVDLDLRSGDMLTLMGANGAGKSTLFRSLLGILGPGSRTRGRITLVRQGHTIELDSFRTLERAGHLGWVGQDPGAQLSAATVRTELLRAAPLPRHRRRDRGKVLSRREEDITSAMAMTELTEVADVHPFDLSPARRKDVVMATALVTRPAVLLLDEPTLGRDLEAMRRLGAFIGTFLETGGAVLATTHDRRWAEENSHRILHLTHGTLHPLDD